MAHGDTTATAATPATASRPNRWAHDSPPARRASGSTSSGPNMRPSARVEPGRPHRHAQPRGQGPARVAPEPQGQPRHHQHEQDRQALRQDEGVVHPHVRVQRHRAGREQAGPLARGLAAHEAGDGDRGRPDDHAHVLVRQPRLGPQPRDERQHQREQRWVVGAGLADGAARHVVVGRDDEPLALHEQPGLEVVHVRIARTALGPVLGQQEVARALPREPQVGQAQGEADGDDQAQPKGVAAAHRQARWVPNQASTSW